MEVPAVPSIILESSMYKRMDMIGAKKQTSVLNNFGYTLIELVIVLVIISLIVALAVPNFDKILGSYQLDISAREMASDIRDLQQKALKTQISTFSMIWNKDSDTYYLMNNTTSYKTVQLPMDIDITAAPYYEPDSAYKMHFSISGRPSGVFGGTVTLKDRTTGKLKYVVINTLGRVRVSETYPNSYTE